MILNTKSILGGLLLFMLAACQSPAPAEAPLWIDVRTSEEYSQDHIEGDLNIPLADIGSSEQIMQLDRDTPINLYCRTGNRAAQAKTLLEAAGFTRVVNVGGIDDARELQGEFSPASLP